MLPHADATNWKGTILVSLITALLSACAAASTPGPAATTQTPLPTVAVNASTETLLPSLQVGLNIYSDSTPNLQVRYENLKIEKLGSLSECETN